MRATHVKHPHMYLWFLGVDPARHGDRRRPGAAEPSSTRSPSGLEVPTYLETATPSNVGFYERDGYAVTGSIEMPSGPRCGGWSGRR